MLKGNIMRELVWPATTKIRTNDRKKRGSVTLAIMSKNIRHIADVTRTDPHYTGKVILRKKAA